MCSSLCVQITIVEEYLEDINMRPYTYIYLSIILYEKKRADEYAIDSI